MNTSAAVKVVEISSNAKTGKVSVSMASQATCPDSCKLKGNGCYAESGLMNIHTGRLNKATADATKIALAQAEAEGIDALSGKRDLRLHVVGDATTNATAKLLSDAAERHMDKAGKKAWSYTHGWREVARKAWGRVSVLASVETLADARKAMARGYAVAMVVSSFASDKASMLADDVKGIPCPSQTRDNIACTDCRLCWDDQALLSRRAIVLFAAHGSGAGKVKKAIG